MQTTIELLDAAKIASGCGTDYSFAKRFGLTLATVSRWRTGKGTFDDDHAAMVARIIGRNEEEIMALCAAERSKDTNTKARWLRAAALLAVAVLPPSAGAGQAKTGLSFDNNSYSLPIMRMLRRWTDGPGLRLA